MMPLLFPESLKKEKEKESRRRRPDAALSLLKTRTEGKTENRTKDCWLFTMARGEQEDTCLSLLRKRVGEEFRAALLALCLSQWLREEREAAPSRTITPVVCVFLRARRHWWYFMLIVLLFLWQKWKVQTQPNLEQHKESYLKDVNHEFIYMFNSIQKI